MLCGPWPMFVFLYYLLIPPLIFLYATASFRSLPLSEKSRQSPRKSSTIVPSQSTCGHRQEWVVEKRPFIKLFRGVYLTRTKGDFTRSFNPKRDRRRSKRVKNETRPRGRSRKTFFGRVSLRRGGASHHRASSASTTSCAQFRNS